MLSSCSCLNASLLLGPETLYRFWSRPMLLSPDTILTFRLMALSSSCRRPVFGASGFSPAESLPNMAASARWEFRDDHQFGNWLLPNFRFHHRHELELSCAPKSYLAISSSETTSSSQRFLLSSALETSLLCQSLVPCTSFQTTRRTETIFISHDMLHHALQNFHDRDLSIHAFIFISTSRLSLAPGSTP